ncbi:unnamed protein product [Urochloa humidicola]
MADHRLLQLHRPASIEKIAVPEKAKVASLFHGSGGAAASSHEAPAVSIATPRTGAAAKQQQQVPGSPRQQCLCSPTMHAGSFRCRLHRGIGGGGGGSVGSGLHEMSKKKPGGV